MFITTFRRKPVRGKMQWICTDSYGFKDINDFQGLIANGGVVAVGALRIVYAFTPNRVNLGSCKRPHHYIWSKS
jgi:hypothetical protein